MNNPSCVVCGKDLGEIITIYHICVDCMKNRRLDDPYDFEEDQEDCCLECGEKLQPDEIDITRCRICLG